MLSPFLRVARCAPNQSVDGEELGPFRVWRISGDGRCLFRSLAQGAHLAAHVDSRVQPSLDPMPLPMEAAAADALRSKICDRLLSKREDMEPFIDVSEAGDYDSYVANMRHRTTWGGEPELAVAAHVLERDIGVYSWSSCSSGFKNVSRYTWAPAIDQGGSAASKRERVALLFHGLGHYDLLIPTTWLIKTENPASRL